MSIIDKPIVEHLLEAGVEETPPLAGEVRVYRPVHRSISLAGSQRLSRLRAVVLLDGSVRKTALTESLSRSLLELPLDAGRTMLDLWRHEIASLTEVVGAAVPCRIAVGQTSRPPALHAADLVAGVSVETDPRSLRGTGGVLRDLVQAYEDDDLVLVANAAQVLVEPLLSVTREASERAGDMTVVANADGTPASLCLATCRALRDLPAVGFVDLKEQGLAAIASRHHVAVLSRATPVGLPVRTPQDYLRALMAYHRIHAGEGTTKQPFGETWRRRFGVVEDGAAVAASVELHNSVVLRGGRVDDGALVVNSVVCGGAEAGVVRRGDKVVGQLVTRTGRKPIETDAG